MTDMLDFYFNESPSRMGMRSSFGGMVAQLQQVAGSGGACEPDYDLVAIALNRKIYRSLMAIEPIYRNVLAAAYDVSGDRVLGVLKSIGIRGEHLELSELYRAASDILCKARSAFEDAFASTQHSSNSSFR